MIVDHWEWAAIIAGAALVAVATRRTGKLSRRIEALEGHAFRLEANAQAEAKERRAVRRALIATDRVVKSLVDLLGIVAEAPRVPEGGAGMASTDELGSTGQEAPSDGRSIVVPGGDRGLL